MSTADAVVWWLLGVLGIILVIAATALIVERMVERIIARIEAEDAGREE